MLFSASAILAVSVKTKDAVQNRIPLAKSWQVQDKVVLLQH
jgi:hypothetical protein